MLQWVSRNTNRLTEAIRQMMYVGLAFHLIAWDDAQQAIVFAAVSAIMALITETNTISTVRVGERIEEKVSATLIERGHEP